MNRAALCAAALACAATSLAAALAAGTTPVPAARVPVAARALPVPAPPAPDSATPMPGPLPMPPAAPGDWPAFGNDPGGSQYSPLTQINAANVGRLQVAWVHRSGDVAGKEGLDRVMRSSRC